MPTTYPKCTATEMLGLLVLLKDHHNEEDLARLADDLDLEIDEILPSVDFAEALQLVKVSSGRLRFSEVGLKLINATIRERKSLLRDQLLQTKLYRTLVRAVEAAPEQRLSDEEVSRLIAFVVAPAEEVMMNIINWGRYAELFRYDPEQHALTLVRHRPTRAPGGGAGRGPPPVATPPSASAPPASTPSASGNPAAGAISVPAG